MRLTSLFAATLVILACGVLSTSAQEYRGSIEGRVVDETGGVLPGVSVAVTNKATGVGSVAVTNKDGIYRLPLLQPGAYRLVAELQLTFRR